MKRIYYSLILLYLSLAGKVNATSSDFAYFEKHVRPLLVEHCLECHDGEKSIKGGLDLSHRDGLRKGGDSGPALDLSNPDSSLILKAIRYQDRDLKMPPKQRLSGSEVEIIRQWIAHGAPDPREGVSNKEIAKLSNKDWWSFKALNPQKPQSSEKVSAWALDLVDQFIGIELEKSGLTPTEDADANTLLRRIYFDLTGLPPQPEEYDSFNMDDLPRLVDRLMATPAFAERWAQHWLDIVRFAESSGGGRTLPFKDAWRYRDYVIESIRSDLPLNQFISEQIAGDLMEAKDWETRRRKLVATSFLALGPTNYEQQDKAQLRMDIVDEQLDTIGKAFMGMTLGCARCHDHKFDPVSIRDYYALAGILRNSHTLKNYTDNVAKWVELPLPLDDEREAKLQEKEAKLAALAADLRRVETQIKKLIKEADAEQRAKLIEEKNSLVALQTASKSTGPQRDEAMSVREDPEPTDCQIHIRGNIRNLGAKVPRGFIQAISIEGIPPVSSRSSGRLELAQWITHDKNPLTARVLVNRVWMHLLGEGLVRSVDNFGTTGDLPTHPELLDHLADSLIQDAWSLKKLIRRIVLTRTYRMASLPQDPFKIKRGEAVDPENRLLWRANRRRLDAHALRDAMLVAGGNLDRKWLGSNVITEGADSNSATAQDLEYFYEFNDLRRSVYTPAFRNRRLELFEAFDFADNNAPIGQRTRSTVVPQALYLLNHSFVIQQSEAVAKQTVESAPSADRRIWVERLWYQILGRSPSEQELMKALRYIGVETPLEFQNAENRLAMMAQVLFASADFRYLD